MPAKKTGATMKKVVQHIHLGRRGGGRPFSDPVVEMVGVVGGGGGGGWGGFLIFLNGILCKDSENCA